MDAETINRMDFDSLRWTIAEAKGWTWEPEDDCYGRWRSPGGSLLDDLPDWPNDIAAAWELVDEIIESDERMSVSVQVKKGNIQFCDLTQWNPFHKPGIVGRGETKEIAICRAWLMWKRSEANSTPLVT